MKITNPPLDSRKGVEILLTSARACSLVLNDYHKKLAMKYDMPIDDIVFSRPIPDWR